MPPYFAQRPSLNGPGTPQYINTTPDIGATIDAVAGTANSLVQQAYTRGMQRRELDMRQQELQLQQQRETREASAQSRQLDIAERGARAREAAAGYTPAHDETSLEYPTPSITTLPMSKVATAMVSGLPSQEGNSPLTRPVDLGVTTPRVVTRHVDESYDPTHSAAYVRSVGMLGARQSMMDELVDRRAANRAPRYLTKVDSQGRYFRENQDTGETEILNDPNGKPIMAPARSTRSSTAEPADIAASRKDLADTGRQQVRAENEVKALKSERRQIQRDNPRAAKPLSAQRTASDSTAAEQYQTLGAQVDSAQTRSKGLTQRADSISGVIDRRRAVVGGTAPASTAPASTAPSSTAPATSDIDADSITDQELAAAHASGARTVGAVKDYVAAARKKGKKK